MEAIDLISRGEAAARLLDDPLLKETLEMLEAGAVQSLRACDVNDTKTLQTLVMGLQAVGGFRGALESVMRTGSNKKEQIEQEGILQTLRGKFSRAIA